MKVSFNQLIRLFLLGSLPFHVMAQPTTSQKYTLQQCLDIAISNNLDVKTAASKMENSDANARQAKAIAVPNVSGSIAQGISQPLYQFLYRPADQYCSIWVECKFGIVEWVFHSKQYQTESTGIGGKQERL